MLASQALLLPAFSGPSIVEIERKLARGKAIWDRLVRRVQSEAVIALGAGQAASKGIVKMFDGNAMRQVTVNRWTPEGGVEVINPVGATIVITPQGLKDGQRLKLIAIESPGEAQHRIKPRERYSRDIHKFIATRRGGFMYFEPTDDFHSWYWLVKFARCVHCGGGLTFKRSKVPADGMVSSAFYFLCDRNKCVIRHSSDVTWTAADQAREEAHRAKGGVDDVRAVYDWLRAKTDEEVRAMEEIGELPV